MKALFKIMLLVIAGAVLLPASPANACSRKVPFSFDELFAADAIVRVTAIKYAVKPDPSAATAEAPDSMVEFKVEEILKGADVPANIMLNGSLSNQDDFNERPVPYKFVRASGRGGSCFANTYRQGAQFLLFLKKTASGYTSNISPLGPANEQLRSENDPWLMWVKVRLNPCDKLNEQDVDYGQMKRPDIYQAMQDQRSRQVKYRMAKCYLQKYEAQDGADDQFIQYIKKWIEKYERDEEQR